MSEERVEYSAGECDNQVDKARRMYDALDRMRERRIEILQDMENDVKELRDQVEALSWAMVLAQNALAESEGGGAK